MRTPFDTHKQYYDGEWDKPLYSVGSRAFVTNPESGEKYEVQITHIFFPNKDRKETEYLYWWKFQTNKEYYYSFEGELSNE